MSENQAPATTASSAVMITAPSPRLNRPTWAGWSVTSTLRSSSAGEIVSGGIDSNEMGQVRDRNAVIDGFHGGRWRVEIIVGSR
jgi:hypothetical protein